MTEALKEIVKFGFTEMNLTRIETLFNVAPGSTEIYSQLGLEIPKKL